MLTHKFMPLQCRIDSVVWLALNFFMWKTYHTICHINISFVTFCAQDFWFAVTTANPEVIIFRLFPEVAKPLRVQQLWVCQAHFQGTVFGLGKGVTVTQRTYQKSISESDTITRPSCSNGHTANSIRFSCLTSSFYVIPPWLEGVGTYPQSTKLEGACALKEPGLHGNSRLHPGDLMQWASGCSIITPITPTTQTSSMVFFEFLFHSSAVFLALQASRRNPRIKLLSPMCFLRQQINGWFPANTS